MSLADMKRPYPYEAAMNPQYPMGDTARGYMSGREQELHIRVDELEHQVRRLQLQWLECMVDFG